MEQPTVTSDEMDEISDRLREAIRSAPTALAGVARVHRSTVYRLLAGSAKTGPRTSTIEAVAVALGVRRSWLAWGEGEMR